MRWGLCGSKLKSSKIKIFSANLIGKYFGTRTDTIDMIEQKWKNSERLFNELNRKYHDIVSQYEDCAFKDYENYPNYDANIFSQYSPLWIQDNITKKYEIEFPPAPEFYQFIGVIGEDEASVLYKSSLKNLFETFEERQTTFAKYDLAEELDEWNKLDGREYTLEELIELKKIYKTLDAYKIYITELQNFHKNPMITGLLKKLVSLQLDMGSLLESIKKNGNNKKTIFYLDLNLMSLTIIMVGLAW